MAEYHWRFGEGFENVGVARRAVVQYAAHWFAGTDLADIELAVGEALANSAEHGRKSGNQVDVRCWLQGRRFIVEVKDFGDGFDSWSAVDYVRPLEHATRGYGIYIMRAVMDEVRYTDHGSRVRLVKLLPEAAQMPAESRRA